MTLAPNPSCSSNRQPAELEISTSVPADLFNLLAAEIRALRDAADALSHGSEAQLLVQVLVDKRRETWAMLEDHWVEHAITALKNQRDVDINPDVIVRTALSGDAETASRLWLYGERIEVMFADLLKSDALGSDKRIALARAWDRYSEDRALVRRLTLIGRPQDVCDPQNERPEGLLPTLAKAVVDFTTPA